MEDCLAFLFSFLSLFVLVAPPMVFLVFGPAWLDMSPSPVLDLAFFRACISSLLCVAIYHLSD